ncbi:protein FAR1-related sequence 5 [Tanacetum coccineum]
MVDGDDPKKKGVAEGSSELKLDIYEHLYLHSQDIGSQLITFNLEGTENYKVWSAVLLALHTRNKIGLINGKCVRHVNKVGELYTTDKKFTRVYGSSMCSQDKKFLRTTLSLDLVHPRWRIGALSPNPEDDLPNDDANKFSKLLSELGLKYQEWPLSKKELATSMITKLVNKNDILSRLFNDRKEDLQNPKRKEV